MARNPDNNQQEPLPVTVEGCRLLFRIQENVFRPAGPSLLLAHSVKIEQGETICDVGTGCGLLAIVAAARGASAATGIDISRSSVELARENARLNGLDSICTFIQSGVFQSAPSCEYDVVVSNPPQTPPGYLEQQSQHIPDEMRIALNGGEGGIEIPIRVISETISHLSNDGRLYLLLVKWHYWQRVVDELDRRFNHVAEVASQVFECDDLSYSFLAHAVLGNAFEENLRTTGLHIGIYEARGVR